MPIIESPTEMTPEEQLKCDRQSRPTADGLADGSRYDGECYIALHSDTALQPEIPREEPEEGERSGHQC